MENKTRKIGPTSIVFLCMAFVGLLGVFNAQTVFQELSWILISIFFVLTAILFKR